MKTKYPGKCVELGTDEQVKVGQVTIVVTKAGVNGGKVKLAIDAPKEMPISNGEPAKA